VSAALDDLVARAEKPSRCQPERPASATEQVEMKRLGASSLGAYHLYQSSLRTFFSASPTKPSP